MSPEHYERVLGAAFPEKSELGRFDLVEAGDNLLAAAGGPDCTRCGTGVSDPCPDAAALAAEAAELQERTDGPYSLCPREAAAAIADRYEPVDPILCSCSCGCSSAVSLPAYEGDRCPMCSEACGP